MSPDHARCRRRRRATGCRGSRRHGCASRSRRSRGAIGLFPVLRIYPEAPWHVSAGYRSRAARFAGRPPAGGRNISPEDQRSLIPPGALAGCPRAPGALTPGPAALAGENSIFPRFSTRVRPARRRPVGSPARWGCFWFRAGSGPPGSCTITMVKSEIGGHMCHFGSGALLSLPQSLCITLIVWRGL